MARSKQLYCTIVNATAQSSLCISNRKFLKALIKPQPMRRVPQSWRIERIHAKRRRVTLAKMPGLDYS